MNISNYTKNGKLDNGSINFPGNIAFTTGLVRSIGKPLDNTSIFLTYADVQKYINHSDSTVYDGQIVTVVNDGTRTGVYYIIGNNIYPIAASAEDDGNTSESIFKSVTTYYLNTSLSQVTKYTPGWGSTFTAPTAELPYVYIYLGFKNIVDKEVFTSDVVLISTYVEGTSTYTDATIKYLASDKTTTAEIEAVADSEWKSNITDIQLSESVPYLYGKINNTIYLIRQYKVSGGVNTDPCEWGEVVKDSAFDLFFGKNQQITYTPNKATAGTLALTGLNEHSTTLEWGSKLCESDTTLILTYTKNNYGNLTKDPVLKIGDTYYDLTTSSQGVYTVSIANPIYVKNALNIDLYSKRTDDEGNLSTDVNGNQLYNEGVPFASSSYSAVKTSTTVYNKLVGATGDTTTENVSIVVNAGTVTLSEIVNCYKLCYLVLSDTALTTTQLANIKSSSFTGTVLPFKTTDLTNKVMDNITYTNSYSFNITPVETEGCITFGSYYIYLLIPSPYTLNKLYTEFLTSFSEVKTTDSTEVQTINLTNNSQNLSYNVYEAVTNSGASKLVSCGAGSLQIALNNN